MRHEKEIDAPSKSIVLKEVLNYNIQVTLSALLTCDLNLRADLIAWLENERETRKDEDQCGFIEEGANLQNIAIVFWEGDALNVMIPMSKKNWKHVPPIVDGGLGINIISKRLYDALYLPRMEHEPFSIKLEDQRKVTPLGLVKNEYIIVARILFLVDFVVMDFSSHNSSFSILLGRPWLKVASVMHDRKNDTLLVQSNDGVVKLNLKDGWVRPMISRG